MRLQTDDVRLLELKAGGAVIFSNECGAGGFQSPKTNMVLADPDMISTELVQTSIYKRNADSRLPRNEDGRLGQKNHPPALKHRLYILGSSFKAS